VDSKCVALTTFRRDGTRVTTPVWFVVVDGEFHIWTGSRTGKVKRLTHDPRCTVAPCTSRGRTLGPAVEGTVRFVDDPDALAVQALLRARYPVQKRALEMYAALRRAGRRYAGAVDRGRHLVVTLVA
jgi:uncharacterized protein